MIRLHVPVALLSGLLCIAASAAQAQQKPPVTTQAVGQNPSLESIESPENTDFWECLNSSGLHTIEYSEAPQPVFTTIAGNQPAAPEEKGPAKRADNLVVNEYGRFEYNEDAIQGGAGDTSENLDPEACGGGTAGTK